MHCHTRNQVKDPGLFPPLLTSHKSMDLCVKLTSRIQTILINFTRLIVSNMHKVVSLFSLDFMWKV